MRPRLLPAVFALAAIPAARAQDGDDALRALCAAAAAGERVLTIEERAPCRALFQADIARARARQQEWMARQVDAFAQRRKPRSGDEPVSLQNFVDDGTIGYGDIVSTDEGLRVFVGEPSRPATRADFVALDSPRSPHRARASELRRAAPRR